MVTEFEQFLIDRFSDERGYRFNNLFEWKGYNLDFSRVRLHSELYEIFSHRYKKEDCSKLLIKHLIKMIPYIQGKMYRNAKSALEELGRDSIMEELDTKIGWRIL